MVDYYNKTHANPILNFLIAWPLITDLMLQDVLITLEQQPLSCHFGRTKLVKKWTVT